MLINTWGGIISNCPVSKLWNVTDVYNLELGVFMYRYFINDLPVVSKEYFIKCSDIHDYPTRHGNDLKLINNKKSFSDHSICNGLIVWNLLSKTIRESKSVKHFHNLFKQNLIKNMSNLEFLSLSHPILLWILTYMLWSPWVLPHR